MLLGTADHDVCQNGKQLEAVYMYQVHCVTIPEALGRLPTAAGATASVM
jgi:hypothetical protein